MTSKEVDEIKESIAKSHSAMQQQNQQAFSAIENKIGESHASLESKFSDLASK